MGMLRIWLQSVVKAPAMGTSATISIVTHAVLIGAAVQGTAVHTPELAAAITQSIHYLPPPDRRGSREGYVEHLRFVDIGSGSPVAVGIGKPQPRGAPADAPQTGGDAGHDPRAQQPSVAEPSPDSVYSVLEAEESAARKEDSAAPAYPPDLMKKGVEGAVSFRFVVDTLVRADSSSVEVLRATNAKFLDAVSTAIPVMRFTPAMIGRRRVRQTVEQTFHFRMVQPAPAEHTRAIASP